MFLAPEELPELRGLRVLRCGLELGELRKGRLDPAHAWALWLQTGALTLDLDRNDPLLRRYMAGESIPADFAGWTLVRAEGCTLGWGKGSGGQLKNHYPKALRRPLWVFLMEEKKKILIVEDERAIVEILKFNLAREGYETLEALDGEAGLQLGLTGDPDLILLDVMLPKMNGFDICAKLRDAGSTVPIIMLTAREEETDKVFGLEAGADDYMTKPFSMRELLARVRANIRRRSLDLNARKSVGKLIEAKGLTIDPATFSVMRNGQAVDLTQKEYDLLLYLIQERGVVFSREDLMQKVWNYDYYGDMRTVDVTVRRLREKIEDDPGKPTRILTRRGAGYYFS